MKIKQKLTRVGSSSLMIIIPLAICKGMGWVAGDILELDFIRKIEVQK